MCLDGNNQRSLDNLNKRFVREYYEGKEWAYMERFAYRQKILELLSLQRKDWHVAKFILDLGCNRGATLSYLREFAKDAFIIGIDVSRSALKKAEKESGFDYVCAVAETLPFDQKVFNCVLYVNLLEHLAKPQNSLKELGRVMRDSGICLVVVPNEVTSIRGIARQVLKNPLRKLSNTFAGLLFPEQGHLNFFTPSTFGKLCLGEHFRVLMTYCDAFIWMELPFLVVFDLVHPKLKYLVKRLVSPLVRHELVLWLTDSMAFYIQPTS